MAAAEIEQSAELFRVLAHETRLRLLLLLASGEQSVGAIDAATGIGQPGLSQQLAVLRKAGLVATRRVAKQIYYRVDPAALQVASGFLARLSDTGVEKTLPREPIAEPETRAPASAAGFARML